MEKNSFHTFFLRPPFKGILPTAEKEEKATKYKNNILINTYQIVNKC